MSRIRLLAASALVLFSLAVGYAWPSPPAAREPRTAVTPVKQKVTLCPEHASGGLM
jgi:hypothetical protein